MPSLHQLPPNPLRPRFCVLRLSRPSRWKLRPQKIASPLKSQKRQPLLPAAQVTPAADTSHSAAASGYVVQIAAVSKQEDADALVGALKKKGYPVFIADSTSDKLLHVQIGPFADIKDAESMRTRLTADGYNPILKR